MLHGHQTQRELFLSVIKQERLGQSYIFSGVRSIGKKLFSFYLAKTVLCLNGTDYLTNSNADCHCASCKLIKIDELNVMSNFHPDLYIYENKLLIDDVRNIKSIVDITPNVSSRKVFIINDAHLLESEAANSFLKTLEEPPFSVHFFLITHRFHRVIPTIVSRCFNVKFDTIGIKEIETILREHNIDCHSGVLSPEIDNNIRYYESKLDELELAITNSDVVGSINFIDNLLDAKLFDNQAQMRQALYFVMMVVFSIYMRRYEATSNREYFAFCDNILLMVRRLDYNVNFELVKIAFLSKMRYVLENYS